jgi:hypothetical protein
LRLPGLFSEERKDGVRCADEPSRHCRENCGAAAFSLGH